ncbi:MAG: type II toxin-antitoxin system VapC family toxin [Chloroflexi bacterium]|nr:type II toxin-antitoxin system VapC family toxin [Chloroflexota bacterium]
MKRVYLDLCAIQRPLDTPKHIRIILESEAILGILRFCELGEIEIVSSDALVYEAQRNPLALRREHAFSVLEKAKEHVSIGTRSEQRAQEFLTRGLKPLDALHLALAEKAGVDYFCTCDDRFLRKARRMQDLSVMVVSPLELIEEVETYGD